MLIRIIKSGYGMPSKYNFQTTTSSLQQNSNTADDRNMPRKAHQRPFKNIKSKVSTGVEGLARSTDFNVVPSPFCYFSNDACLRAQECPWPPDWHLQQTTHRSAPKRLLSEIQALDILKLDVSKLGVNQDLMHLRAKMWKLPNKDFTTVFPQLLIKCIVSQGIQNHISVLKSLFDEFIFMGKNSWINLEDNPPSPPLLCSPKKGSNVRSMKY